MSHLHGRKLQEAFSERNTAEEKLSVTTVAASVFVLRTPSAPSNAVYVLVAFARVFRKIYSSPKHSSDVSVSLIKAFLGNSLNKGRAVEEHPLVALIVVFLSHLSPPVTVLLPQFGVPDLLDFENPII